MSSAPKKLPPDSEVPRVFHINTDRRLTFVQPGSIVWSHFRLAYKAFLDQKGRLSLHRGLGQPAQEPMLYSLYTRHEHMKKNQKTQGGEWELVHGARIDRLVDDDELLVLKVELVLETGKTG